MSGTLSKDVALNVIGQITEFAQAAAQIPGVTEAAAGKAALKMQAVFVKQAQDQIKLQQKTANQVVAIEDAASKKIASGFSASFAAANASIKGSGLVTGIRTIDTLLAHTGGTVGMFASQMKAVVRPVAIVTEAMGGVGSSLVVMGGAAVASVAAVGALAYGIYSLGGRAVDAKAELEKFNVVLSPDEQRKIDSYSVGAERLSIAIDKVEVAAGGPIAQDIGAIKTGLADFVTMASSAVDKGYLYAAALYGIGTTAAALIGQLTGLTNTVDLFNKAIFVAEAVTNPYGTLIDALLDSFKQENDHLLRGKQASDEFTKAMQAMDVATQQSNDALKEQIQRSKERAAQSDATVGDLHRETEAEKELAQELTKIGAMLDKGAASLQRYEQFEAENTKKSVGFEQAIRDAYAVRFDELDTFFAEGTITAKQYADSRTAIEKNMDAELTAAAQKYTDDWSKAGPKQQLQMLEDLHSQGLIDEQDYLDAKLQLNKAYNLQLQTAANAAYYKQSDEEIQAYTALYDRVKSEQQHFEDYMNQSGQAIAQSFVDAAGSIADRYMALDQQIIQADTDKLSKLKSNESALTTKLQSETDKKRATVEAYELQTTQSHIDATNEQMAQDKKLARNTAIASRAVSVFSIALSTAEAIAKAIAEWGPPPSPAGILGIASAVAVGGAQATAVLAQPLPTFYQGTARIPGAADEIPATLHPGEAVLNARAARDLGPAIVNALNAGLSPLAAMTGGGPGDVYLDNVAVGRVMARQARSAGAFGQTVRTSPVGFVNPYGRH